MKLRLLIVDDHAVIREGVMAMLRVEPQFADVATAVSWVEAVAACEACMPDVVLLDVRMPGRDGFSTLETLRNRWPDLRVMMLSSSATAAEVKLARRLGASGYLPKSIDRSTLVRALGKVAAGGEWFTVEPSIEAEGIPALTARELEVVQHLGRGLSNHYIGIALGVGGETIKSHFKAIFAKLGVASREEALWRAKQLGLLLDER